MKRSLVKLVSLSFLMATMHFGTVACSSSEEGVEEEVAADGEENAAEVEDGNVTEGDNMANNEENLGNNEENFGNNEENFGNNEENMGNNNFGNTEGNMAAGNEFGNQAEGGNPLMGAEGTGDANLAAETAGAEDNMQQIMDEINQAPVNEAAPTADAGAGFDNISGTNEAAAPVAEAPSAAPVTSAPAAPGLPELGSKMAYIVQKGDTLAKIAGRIYGDMNKWTEIADFTGIANPKLIYPGDVVYYQLTDRTQTFASAYEGIGRSEVEVGPGDTLATISQRVLGNSTLWKLIWRQNDKIDNPDKLVAGTKVYYIDSSKLAQVESELNSKIVKTEKSIKAKVVKAEKSEKAPVSKTVSASADQVVDFYQTVSSQNLVSQQI